MIDAELEHWISGEPPFDFVFEPHATYSRRGDCVFFMIAGESYRAERLNSLVTVFYGRQSKTIVGCMIKGFKAHIQEKLRQGTSLVIVLKGARVNLATVFEATKKDLGSDAPDTEIQVYDLLRDAAEKYGAEVELEADRV